MDVVRRVFGTVQLSLTQWSLALVPAVLLVFLWEFGKSIAGHEADRAHDTKPGRDGRCLTAPARQSRPYRRARDSAGHTSAEPAHIVGAQSARPEHSHDRRGDPPQRHIMRTRSRPLRLSSICT